MAKKKNETTDVAADFFGDDDMDWMDDEEEEEEEEEDGPEPSETLPVAPPPAAPPPTPPAALGDGDWADRVSAAPEGEALGNAPTLHFSSVQTLPPQPAPEGEDAPASAAPAAEAAATEEPVAAMVEGEADDMGTLDDETSVSGVEMIESGMAKALASAAPDAEAPADGDNAGIAVEDADEDEDEDEDEEVAEESAVDEEDEATEVAPTEDVTFDPKATPPPAMAYIPPANADTDAPPPGLDFTPPPSTLEKWVPQGEEDTWRAAATALVSEAPGVDDEAKAILLDAAARINETYLGEYALAESLLRDADAAGASDPWRQASLARVLLRQMRPDECADALREAASRSESAAVKADWLLEASKRVAASDGNKALELARAATEAAPESLLAWQAMDRLLAGREGAADEAIAAKGTLAGLQSGFAAAEAQLARAVTQHGAADLDGAKASLEGALASWPSHGGAFIALENLLITQGDSAALAQLYAAEAERNSGADAGWWWLQSSRAHGQAGDAEAAAAGVAKAAQLGSPLAGRELQAAAMRSGDHAALADSIASEVAEMEGAEAAFLWFWLGQVREGSLGDAEGAMEAYRSTLAADAEAGPAVDGLVRLLSASGDHAALRELWQARLDSAPEAERPALHLRLGEVAESEANLEEARAQFESAAASTNAAVREVAASGLSRVLFRSEAWSELADHYLTTAAAAATDADKASWLQRAADAGPHLGLDDRTAVERLREVMRLQPDNRAALFSLSLRLENLGDWEGLASLLSGAADAEVLEDTPAVVAAMKYRAARIRLAHGLDSGVALGELETAREKDPEFAPALWTLRRAKGEDAQTQRELYQSQADQSDGQERIWAHFAAGLLADHGEGSANFRAILDDHRGHAGALAALELAALLADDKATLLDLWDGAMAGEPSTSKAQICLANAQLLRDEGRVEDASRVLADLVAQVEVEGRPLSAASRVAEAIGNWDMAIGLLDGLEDADSRLHRNWVHLLRKGDVATALADLKAWAVSEDFSDAAALLFIQAADRAGDAEASVAARQSLVAHSEDGCLKTATQRELALQIEASEGDARAAWEAALSSDPDSTVVFDGLVRSLVAAQDGDALRAVFADKRPNDCWGLATALTQVEDTAGARAVLADAMPEGAASMPFLIELEMLDARLDDWQSAYDRATARRAFTTDDGEKSSLDARRRWMLAEKLADTDQAWELYRALHEESPDDRDVTEALARIAGARGESAMAIEYLEKLAGSTEDASESARIQRRIGEVHETAGDGAAARQAFLNALDHQNDDVDSLAAIRRLSEAEGDWDGVIAVLKREVDIANAERRLALRREIATITDTHLEDKGVAMDAWRAVLEEASDARDALARLMELAEERNEWDIYVETGEALAALSEGSERSTLLRQVGLASMEHLDSEGAVRFLEQAILTDRPDLEAAVKLEQHYRKRGDWGGAIRSLIVQAEANEASADKAAALRAAANVELEHRHDREAAAALFAKVLEVDEMDRDSLRFMASHLYEKGVHAEALKSAMKLEPHAEEGQDLDDFDVKMELSDFYYAIGEMLRLSDRPAESLQRYERVLKLNPTHIASLEAAGPLYMQAASWKEAENVYRQLLQLTGGHGDRAKVAQIYASLGMTEHALGRVEKAHKRFSKALELYPNHTPALKGMAKVLTAREDWSNLLHIYNEVILHTLEPSDVVEAYMAKGRVLDSQMQRPDKAAQHFQRSLDYEPNLPEAYLRLAELAMRRDAYDEAQTLAEKALVLDNDVVGDFRPLLYLCVAAGHHSAGRAEDAETRIGDARSEGGHDINDALGESPLDDLDALRKVIFERL